MDFAGVVELLVQVHDAEIERFQAKIRELECSSKPPPYGGIDEERSREEIALILAGDAPGREDSLALLQPRNSSPTPTLIGVSAGDKGTVAIPRVSILPPSFMHGQAEAAPNIDYPFDDDSPHSRSPNGNIAIDADELVSEDWSVGGEELAQPVRNKWFLFVAKLLGSYRDPLQPHDIWQQVAAASSAQSSASNIPVRGSCVVNHLEREILANDQRRAIAHCEKQTMPERKKNRTLSVFGAMVPGSLTLSLSLSLVPIDSLVRIRHVSSLFTRSMIHPTSSVRLCWVFLCLLMVSYEIFLMTMTPFGLSENQWARSFDFFSAGFWTVDIAINFRSGILIKGGKIEMRSTVVAKHYVQSWFIFDCGIASIQWYTVHGHLTGSSSAAGSLASLTVVRLLRLGRLSKILKRFDFQNALLLNFGRIAYVMMYYMKVFNEVAKGLVAAILIVHCTACAWYEVGKGPDGWAANYEHLLSGNVLNDYLVCMHWSLAQFQGNVDVYPGTSLSGRAFACLSTCISIVFLTFFVSTLTGTLVSLRDERKRRRRDVTTMSRFLDRQPMPSDVMLRAVHYVNTWEIQEGERMSYEEDQKALELFPKGLRRQLVSAILAPYLESIPVFVFMKQYHANALAAICVDSITQHVCSTDEDLFTNREPAKRTYIILSGQITYNSTPQTSDAINSLVEKMSFLRQYSENKEYKAKISTASQYASEESIPRSSVRSSASFNPGPELPELPFKKMLHPDGHTVVKRLTHGDIISEAAMWLPCIHEGDLCSLSICHCLLVCCSTLRMTVSRYDTPLHVCADYALRFARAAEDLIQSTEKRSFIDLLGAKDILDFEGSR